MKIIAVETNWTRIPFQIRSFDETASSHYPYGMPLITYAGHLVRIDHAYSFARVSSPQQTDGEGLERQMRRSREWSQQYGVPIDQELSTTASGSKGYHIRRGNKLGALGAFLEAVEQRLLKPHPVMLVESFSRLGRLEILDAVDVFQQIINRGVALITLSSNRISG
jgi:DNA invertase Pin-like site-specific DNA recombinase